MKLGVEFWKDNVKYMDGIAFLKPQADFWNISDSKKSRQGTVCESLYI